MIQIKSYNGLNIQSLELLGKGTQGSVYKINDNRCIKIFKKETAFKEELHSLLIAQIDNHFPRLYEYGDNYIIRELVSGISLDNYLKVNPLDLNVCNKIIEIYNAMNYVGYSRLDSALFHLFLLSNNNIKIIDTAKAMKKKYSYPRILLHDLDKLNFKNKFLKFVKINHSDLYSNWQKLSKNFKE
ncbi:MAG: hypothetical protein E7214_07270 [Clostridium sp.]|nr:hypothetical protein [Clostridium sp.]